MYLFVLLISDTKLNDNTTNITPDGPKVGGIDPTPGKNSHRRLPTCVYFNCEAIGTRTTKVFSYLKLSTSAYT